jgi:hypothetical protein
MNRDISRESRRFCQRGSTTIHTTSNCPLALFYANNNPPPPPILFSIFDAVAQSEALGFCNAEDLALNIFLWTYSFITNYAVFLEQSPVYHHTTVSFETLRPIIVRRTECPVITNFRRSSSANKKPVYH